MCWKKCSSHDNVVSCCYMWTNRICLEMKHIRTKNSSKNKMKLILMEIMLRANSTKQMTELSNEKNFKSTWQLWSQLNKTNNYITVNINPIVIPYDHTFLHAGFNAESDTVNGFGRNFFFRFFLSRKSPKMSFFYINYLFFFKDISRF